jgi:NADH-quinone oxidoreductase subunit D
MKEAGLDSRSSERVQHARAERAGDIARPLQSQLLHINMGPQHPSTHGVLRLFITTDGEIVHSVVPYVGYLHRCAEKIAEGNTYHQYVIYTDRMDYLAAMNCNWTWCLAVEKLMEATGVGVEIPEYAEYVRVVIGELNRIASHLIAFGTYGLDIGAMTPFFHALREREAILNIFEKVCGARLMYSYYDVGGLKWDIPDDAMEEIRLFLKMFPQKIVEYDKLLTTNRIFVERTADVGIIDAATAHAYGCTGPVLRGAGVKWDLRRNQPYSIYDRFEFDIPTGTGAMGTVGDCWDRYWVRMEEMRQSWRIVSQAVEQMPPRGEVMAKMPRSLKIPPGEIYFSAENPKGELGFYVVSDGGTEPFRAKTRSPAFHNLHVIEKVGQGQMISDLVATVGSLDLVLGEIDR